MTSDGVSAATLPGLRDPSNRVSRRAIGYWTARAVVDGLVVLAIEVSVAAGMGLDPGWAAALSATALVVVAYALIVPRWRYHVHRWEVTSDAVYTRTGWLSVTWRIAPISRIQTIDSHRWFGERLFGLANVTATTASAEGPVHIRALDRVTADQLLDELTVATGRMPGDAT
jgi:membrane protein YdbS with pleckstrin-like domain